MFLYLRKCQRYKFNYKREWRIYRELELNLRIQFKREIKRDKPETPSVPNKYQSNLVNGLDFMSDLLIDDRSIKTFNVVDNYNREDLNIDVD